MTQSAKRLSATALLAIAALFTACSQTAPSKPIPSVTQDSVARAADGRSSANAVTTERIRLRRVNGPDIVTALVTGQVIDVPLNTNLDVWAEIRRLETDRARLTVDWGNGNSDFSGCGACRLENKYTRAGRYTLKAEVIDLNAPSGTAPIQSVTVTLNVYDFTLGDTACAVAPGSLTTFFASNNGGSTGGAIYFDLNPAQTLSLTALDINTGVGAGTAITLSVYTRSGTFAGGEGNIALWTLRTTGSGTAAAQDSPSRVTLAQPVTLAPGTNGVAIVASNFGHRYTNGTGGNQNHTNGTLSLAAGTATNSPFDGSPFSPRVANMSFYYGCPQ